MKLAQTIATAIQKMKSDNARVAAANVQAGSSPQSARIGSSANKKFDVWLSQDGGGQFSVEGIDWDAFYQEQDAALRKR